MTSPSSLTNQMVSASQHAVMVWLARRVETRNAVAVLGQPRPAAAGALGEHLVALPLVGRLLDGGAGRA